MQHIEQRLATIAADPLDFQRWLAAQPADEEIGRACRSGECPVAEYLLARFDSDGILEAIAEPADLWLEFVSGSVHTSARQWARPFIEAVDALTEGVPRAVTVTEARRVLDSVLYRHEPEAQSLDTSDG